FLYGTYEARIKVAKGSGVVNTFFGYYDEDPLPGNDHEVNKEIDIEIFGEEPTTWILFSCWLSHQSKTQKWFDTRTLGINDLSLGFHVYRFQWSPTEVKFYIDGCQAEVIETNVPQTGIPIATGLWVCQQLDLSCCWNSGLPCYPGFPLPTTNNSGEMVVDYVCITPGTLTPTQGLVAYYPFNGNANDESGNNNHGRVCGALSVQDRFGSPSQAYEFGASNDTIPLPASINITGSMSISFWVSTTMVDTGNWPFASFLVDRDICGYSRDWSVGLGHGGKIQFNTGMSNRDSVLTSAQDINTNSWNHVTVVRDATNGIKRIYINGVHDAAAPFDNQSFANNSRQIFLAASVCNTSTHHFFRGRMDDVRFYTRVISDAEIQQLYHEGGW
ncbi:family 16 glycosylhydrolase, partial [bacterium]|nr:family 16 glycosylhydrolase [bacterium]MBU1984774.1 family 16 glycosylhydrolase [bacterium]